MYWFILFLLIFFLILLIIKQNKITKQLQLDLSCLDKYGKLLNKINNEVSKKNINFPNINNTKDINKNLNKYNLKKIPLKYLLNKNNQLDRKTLNKHFGKNKASSFKIFIHIRDIQPISGNYIKRNLYLQVNKKFQRFKNDLIIYNSFINKNESNTKLSYIKSSNITDEFENTKWDCINQQDNFKIYNKEKLETKFNNYAYKSFNDNLEHLNKIFNKSWNFENKLIDNINYKNIL